MNMANNKRYWTGLDDLHQTEAFQELQGQEFPQHEAIDEALGNEGLTSATTGRRDFLKFMGFSLAAALGRVRDPCGQEHPLHQQA